MSVTPLLRSTAARIAVVVCASFPTHAQDVDNAVLRARDAFGERIGVEQVGLYNEQQVRGFSLGDTASYRIDGLYVLREFQFPDTLLAGVTVKVGVSSARLDYPSPSGVVDYRLKDAKPGAQELSVNFGIRDFGTRFVEFSGSYSPNDGKWGIAGGIQTLPDVKYPNGTGGHNHGFGFVPVWRPNDQVRVRTVFSGDRSTYDGDYNILSAIPNALPPKTNGQNLSLRGARVLRYSYNGGALVDVELSRRWSFAGTVFYSDTERSPQDFSLVALRPDRTADITLIPTQGRHNWALTGGGIVKYAFESTAATHEFSTALRGRQSADQNRSQPSVRLLNVDTTRDPYPSRPLIPGPLSSVISEVDQVIGSVGYAGNYFDRLELRGGLHRTRYTKTVTAANGNVAERVDNTWFYNASAVFAATDDLTVFANAVKGVEESGVAPQNALNRSEVLPQVTAEQYEVGARYALTPKLSLTVAAFDTTKLTPGLRPDGIFTLVGEVNHRGAEVSLAGEVTPGTTVVVGGMAMRPRLSGTLVDAGVIGRKPAAISSTVGIASIDHRLSWAPGWSVDARITWTGGREANAANTLQVPGFAVLGAGGRYTFTWSGRPMLLRFAVSNLFTNRPFLVFPGGNYGQSPGTTGRISLRIGLMGD